MFKVDLDDRVLKPFEDIFGLHDIHSDSGYKIEKDEAEGLYQYFIDLKENEIIKIPFIKINLEIQSIRQLIDTETNLYMTASVQNVMVDLLNRYLIREGKQKYPEVNIVKSYIVEILKRFDDVNKFMSEKNIGEENFDKCLKHHILNAQFRSNIFAIMQKYKKEGRQLKQILGAIHLCSPTEHHVHITIDLEKKFL